MSCKKCGECCKYVAVILGDMDEDDIRWSEYHSHVIVKRQGKTVVFIPSRCGKLGEDNLCKVYKDRPRACIQVPSVGCTIFQPPGCRYFECE